MVEVRLGEAGAHWIRGGRAEMAGAWPWARRTRIRRRLTRLRRGLAQIRWSEVEGEGRHVGRLVLASCGTAARRIVLLLLRGGSGVRMVAGPLL
ncbi:hypothetical protein ZWY2020_036186 [Hordeum vulgare]|nr:hypothetical protein ZWY2020_036186 [Hordeum vulgare]